jgi:hypothetical protein
MAQHLLLSAATLTEDHDAALQLSHCCHSYMAQHIFCLNRQSADEADLFRRITIDRFPSATWAVKKWNFALAGNCEKFS